MLKTLLILSICYLSLYAVSCGDDCTGLCGSQCDRIDCSYNVVQCRRYDDVSQPAIQIDYLRNPDTAREWAAKIVIEVDNISPVSGHLFEGNEFLNGVYLQRPGGGEQFPDFTGNYCRIDSGGDEIDKGMSGKCSFIFTNGANMTADFSCQLEAPI